MHRLIAALCASLFLAVVMLIAAQAQLSKAKSPSAAGSRSGA